MSKNMFDLDDSLFEDKTEENFDEQLELADLLCLREQYDKALKIYNSILDKDMKNEKATIGLLRVHSDCFTKFEGDKIDQDIRIIERLFPNTMDIFDFLVWFDIVNRK